MAPEERAWLQKVAELKENNTTIAELEALADESNKLIQKAKSRKDWGALTSLSKVIPCLTGGEPKKAKTEAKKLLEEGFPSKVSEYTRVEFPGS